MKILKKKKKMSTEREMGTNIYKINEESKKLSPSFRAELESFVGSIDGNK